MSENNNLKQNKSSIVILIVVAIVIVVVVGYGIFQSVNNDNSNNNFEQTTESTQISTTEEPTTQEATTAPTTTESTTVEPTTKPPETEPETEPPTEPVTEAQNSPNQQLMQIILYETFDRTISYSPYETETIYFKSDNLLQYSSASGRISTVEYSLNGNNLTIYNFPLNGELQNITYIINYDTAIAAHGEYYKLYFIGDEPLSGEWSGYP